MVFWRANAKFHVFRGNCNGPDTSRYNFLPLEILGHV